MSFNFDITKSPDFDPYKKPSQFPEDLHFFGRNKKTVITPTVRRAANILGILALGYIANEVIQKKLDNNKL